MIDRCFYRGDPDHISVGWMGQGGHQDIKEGSGRSLPEITPKTGDKSIFLADYNGKIGKADTIRLHPENAPSQESLRGAIGRHGIARGYSTTALATAALMGLKIECLDSGYLMAKNWQKLLPYADWHKSEIESGELWAHLR